MKSKWYVVWKGVLPGVYSDWAGCKRQVEGFNAPLYKAFLTREEAIEAYKAGPWDYIGTKHVSPEVSDTIIVPSISVDAACSCNPGAMEYRGVDTATGKELFRKGPFVNSTNNIGEFLALVHGLAMLKQQNSPMPIYTDSVTAIAWVRQKKCKSTLRPEVGNPEVSKLIARADAWLKENTYTTKIYKWETEQWGEIPADFGRKGRK